MNPGTYLLILVVATIGAAIAMVWYRDLIWPQKYPPEQNQRTPRESARPARRAPTNPPARSKRAIVQNEVIERSSQQNAEKPKDSSVQEFNERSKIETDLPADHAELQRLAHALVLYAKRPNKQLAIEAAWNCTKGQGEEWKRGSALFNAAMGDSVRAAVKEKEPQEAQQEITQ